MSGFRPGELAERLGLSRVTLWRWERAGQLPAKRQVGPNVVGWLQSEIDEWFALTDSDGDDKPPESSTESEPAGAVGR